MRRVVLVACLLGSASTALQLPRVGVKDGMLVSKDDGRTLMFRGINSVIKRFPWYDPKIRDPVRQQQLQDWGFNNVRLGMMWSGLEPAEGYINETYSNIIQEIVGGLADHGIHSYLDMHQDVLIGEAEYYGIPEWVYSKMDPPEHPYPWPMKDTSGFSTWACGYFSQTVSNAFQQLYTNGAGSADLFARFWFQVASRFKNNTAILGYELMNEPWTGDIYQDPSLLLPGNAGYNLLEPFFNRANDAIRSVDDETIVFWEPTTYAYLINPGEHFFLDAFLDAYLHTHNISIFFPILKQACGDLDESFELDVTNPKGVLKKIYQEVLDSYVHSFNAVNKAPRDGKPNIWSPGFTAPPGGPEYLDRTVLSWHYYCWAIGFGGDDDFDPVLRAACDDFFGPMVFRTVEQRAADLGGSATFLTEFGLCEPNATLTNSTGVIECNFLLDQADLYLQSWSYWDTAGGGAFWDSQGEPILDRVKVFTRPYPPATAGRPLSLKFDHTTRMFEYIYAPDLSIGGPTEIFVPPLVYTDGYAVDVPVGVEWMQDSNKILVSVVDVNFAGDVLVKISPL